MVFRFEPGEYGNAVAALILPIREADLGPGRANTNVRQALKSLTLEDLRGSHGVVDVKLAQACVAGLWLYHDFLDESHEISQSLSGSTGSYWHGIMHRREPDAANAKYWFRQVGRHEIFPRLLTAAREIVPDDSQELADVVRADAWDPFLFIDRCEAARGVESTLAASCRQVQLLEWQLLFDFCWRGATGS